MPGENSGGGKDAGYTPPAPVNNPGGKTRTRVKRRQTQAPSRPAPKPQPRRPTPPRQPSRAKSSFNGSGELGYGGQDGGATSSALGGVSLPAAPDLNTFLTGDSAYQSQLAALQKALGNYQSQMQDTQEEYNADFGSRLKDLNLTESRNTEDQANDYAGRGMFISGLYGKARGDLEQDFDKREGDMNLAKQTYMSGLNRDLVNFQEDTNLSREKAKQDAMSRRSLQYGV